MNMNTKVDPLGDMFESKNKPGFYMRKVLVPDGQGGRTVIMIGSKDAAKLSSLKTGSEICIKPSTDFYFAA